MSGSILTFIVNKNTFYVTLFLEKKEKVFSFDEFYATYLDKESLKINKAEYSKENLIRFVKRGIVNEEFSFDTENGGRCIFKITNETEESFEIEFINNDVEEKSALDFDYLTKVHSRSYLFEAINKELESGNNENSYLFIIDLDNFKAINDTHGHLIGDICLKTIAGKLNEIYEKYIFGRYGGDEFIVFAKNVSIEVLDDLLSRTLKVRFSQNEKMSSKGAVTCSIGVSEKVGKRTSISELIEEADRVLYKSKKLGKNIAVKFDGDIIYGDVERKKSSKIAKGQSSLIFREEVAKKRTRHAVYIALVVVIFTSLMVLLDVFFNGEVSKQTKATATDLMKEESDIASLKIYDDSQEVFTKLSSSKEMLDGISASDSDTLIKNMLNSLSKNALIKSPGILLENGDVYLEGGDKYNVSSFNIASDIIRDNKSAIERISAFGKEDQILIGEPYARSLAFSGDDNLDIVGITSMYSVSEYSSMVFSTFKSDYYGAIVDSNMNKVCENSTSGINVFSKYSNFNNYFDYNNLVDEKNTFTKIVESNSYDIDLIQLEGGSYFVYSSSSTIADWSIIMLARYETISATFGTIINFSLASLNSLCIIFLCFSVVTLIYCNKIRLDGYKGKYIDPLTNSINEQRFISDAEILVTREDGQRYLVYMNIRRFKFINTALGNKNANRFLAEMTAYFESRLKDNEVLSREYSDRFVMLLEEKDDEELKTRIDSIVKGALDSETLNKYSRISFDVGVYRFDFKTENKVPVWLAVDRAKKAASEVIRSGNNYGMKFFSEKMLQDEELEIYIEQSQELALQEDRFEIYYQGKYDLHTKTFKGAEALVRWKDDRRGFINTQKFIDVLERNGFVTKLDIHIFEKAVKDIKDFIDSGKEPLKVSVNLSRKHFENLDFFKEYEKVVEKYNVPWKYLEFEITESIILNSDFDLDNLIARIHELGGQISIDDFGSGFSNFSMINHVDYDILKLDRKLLFGRDNKFDEYSKNVLKSIVSLNRDMHNVTLCEGVEHKEESDYLESIGCDLIQGYLYSRPLPKDEFIALIEKTNK